MLARNVRVEVVRKVPADAVLVDFDHDGIYPRGLSDMREHLRAAGYRVRSMQVFSSRRHVHLVIRLKPSPRSLVEKIALQLLCGSDRAREANNLRRARLLRRMPGWARKTANVLYEK